MFSVLKDTPPKLIFDDVELYDSIELETFTPWFMCQVTEYDEIFKCSFGNMKFISSIEALIDLNTSAKLSTNLMSGTLEFSKPRMRLRSLIFSHFLKCFIFTRQELIEL